MPRDKALCADLTELERYLAEHPDTQYVDAIFFDLCGIVRGKRYPRRDLKKLFKTGFPIPYSVYFLDVTGECSDPCGRGFSDGDPDGVVVPTPGTLVPVPWVEEEAGQILLTMIEPDGTPSMVDPRNVAAQAVARFAETGLRPVVAFELEFYLVDKARDDEGAPQAPILPSTGERDDATQVYSMTQLEAFSPFFSEVEEAGRAQNVPASIASTEYAPGQYEINLRHVDRPLDAADHCAMLRHIIKRVADKHDLEATFMSKPFPDNTGNGMHLHLSLVDAEGRNVFDDGSELGSPLLRHVVAGLADTMPEAMAIFAPNVNAYRRFGPNLFVPVTKSWGANNRSFAFRIPAGPGEARRIEHRVAGADANPYLVLAAVLAGAHHGLVNKLDPGEPWEGNATEEVDPDIPMDLERALARLERSEVLRRTIDPDYLTLYAATKRNELRKFFGIVPAHEYTWYL